MGRTPSSARILNNVLPRMVGDSLLSRLLVTKFYFPVQILCFLLLSTATGRREASLGLATGSLQQEQQGWARPIDNGTIDLEWCTQAETPAGKVGCCPPRSKTPVVDFVHNTQLPSRLRQPVHLLSSDYIAKYIRAYELMKALPPDDPRNFDQQANIHCAYCDGAFLYANSTERLHIHRNWFFFPWHRWFLYFHERILASLIEDDTFALPFWNWDNQFASDPLPNVIPQMYLTNPVLFDDFRNPDHFPPRLADLNFVPGDGAPISDSKQREENNALMYKQLVNARTTRLFYGKEYHPGDSKPDGLGTIESAPHNTVHKWTGSSAKPHFEDMGVFYSAARDPIFYPHHANLDRLWTVWKTLPRNRKGPFRPRRDYKDLDWLNATFLFYDEKRRLVRVRVRDALKTEQLGYRYQDIHNAWVTARPSTVAGAKSKPLVSASPDSPPTAAADVIEEFGEAVSGKIQKLESVFSTKVKRPLKLTRLNNIMLNNALGLNNLPTLFSGRGGDKSDDDDDEVEEILVIQGVELDYNKATKFDVYINYPNANENTSVNVVEFAGTFVNVPDSAGKGHIMETEMRLGISDTLEQLGLEDADYIVVTLVPRGSSGPVTFKGFKIKYET
ncbi:polyphenol oxidase I, chloroplastic [Selaginella moellendorffii]|uniref:polyphenol oxidase I, chloroplastic n=1 Tax=Selaginella moellendorffii TaxID=88036 RepID=UPI000D1C5156|nr:polyphenol oxidase I, chloroplastic [Selaginella moellendorffii]|eukprot:XP_024531515.1 polyphenol oxidase I, chloroplastic [Selaginella moellendorffii]